MSMLVVIIGVALAYFIGYAVGRKDVIDDIKEMTRELKERESEDQAL